MNKETQQDLPPAIQGTNIHPEFTRFWNNLFAKSREFIGKLLASPKQPPADEERFPVTLRVYSGEGHREHTDVVVYRTRKEMMPIPPIGALGEIEELPRR